MHNSNIKQPINDSDWITTQLDAVSRTFALSLQHLPEPMETYSSLSYLLCRIPDTVEDTPALDPGEKKSLLLQYENAFMLQDSAATDKFVSTAREQVDQDKIADQDSWDLLFETQRVFDSYQQLPVEVKDRIKPHIQELVYGMHNTVNQHPEGVRLESVDEFDQYCYYVAGKVGHLLAELVSEVYSVPLSNDIYSVSEEYGLLLQTVNIGKDVYDDYIEENNVYLPESLLSEYGGTQDPITDSNQRDAVINTVSDLLDEFVHSNYESAESFLQWLQSAEESAVSGLAIPYYLAVATTRDLEEHQDLVTQEEEVKISRGEVLEITQTLVEDAYTSLPKLHSRIMDREFC